MGSSWLPTLLTCRLYHILFLIYVHALRKICETLPHITMEHVYTNFCQLNSTCKRLCGTYYTDRALILSFSAMKSSLLLEITESTINMLMLLSYFCVENWTKSLGQPQMRCSNSSGIHLKKKEKILTSFTLFTLTSILFSIHFLRF